MEGTSWPPGRTVASILMLNGSNDVFPPKEVPFGGEDDGWSYGENIPQKLPKKGVNMGPGNMTIVRLPGPETLSDLGPNFER